MIRRRLLRLRFFIQNYIINLKCRLCKLSASFTTNTFLTIVKHLGKCTLWHEDVTKYFGFKVKKDGQDWWAECDTENEAALVEEINTILQRLFKSNE